MVGRNANVGVANGGRGNARERHGGQQDDDEKVEEDEEAATATVGEKLHCGNMRRWR